MDKIDLRVSKTDKMIRDAFLDLIDTVGFEKISVIDLTKKAMISRTTFYLHYKDKYDLLEKMENDILSGLKDIATDLVLDEIVANGLTSEKIFPLLLRVYDYIKENQRFFKSILCENGDPSFYYKLNDAIKLIYPQNIDSDMFKISKNYILAFIIGIHTSIINEWIKTGMKETPQEIVSMITQILNDVPKNIYK